MSELALPQEIMNEINTSLELGPNVTSEKVLETTAALALENEKILGTQHRNGKIFMGSSIGKMLATTALLTMVACSSGRPVANSSESLSNMPIETPIGIYEPSATQEPPIINNETFDNEDAESNTLLEPLPTAVSAETQDIIESDNTPVMEILLMLLLPKLQ